MIEALRSLGVPEPESWADSELQMGQNALGAVSFLALAWSQIGSARDMTWIDQELEFASETSGVGLSLQRLLEAGASREDLTRLVRVMQSNLLFNICCMLDANRKGAFLNQSGYGLPT